MDTDKINKIEDPLANKVTFHLSNNFIKAATFLKCQD